MGGGGFGLSLYSMFMRGRFVCAPLFCILLYLSKEWESNPEDPALRLSALLAETFSVGNLRGG